MPADRITKLSIQGMRCIESLELDLRDFTVLIGENGTGKSTIIEALELLRKAATAIPLIDKIYHRHDGTSLVHQGSRHLSLAVTIEGDGPELTYTLRILRDQTYLSIAEEKLVERGTKALMERAGTKYKLVETNGIDAEQAGTIEIDEAVLPHARFLKLPQLARVQQALASIEVYPSLDLRRTWTTLQASQTARSSNLVRPADRLEPGGTNLVNMYAALRNQRNWKETLGRLRVALGDIDDMLFVNEATGGTQTIGLRWRNGPEVLLSGLSDGQVSALALIAIQQLQRHATPSIIAIDEPETHLHPALIARVAIELQELSDEAPILVGTQSDPFLNAIEHPEDAVVLCQLNEHRQTALIRPDREQLRVWLGEFKGLGTVRSEGLQSVIFP
ncbi:MAG TPA: AAA family ATPase [Kofleriaceae bacterium]|nr:AAA family ATPase [Kofleriaceae bacterium]